eukprot:scpid40973/ scgid14837/ 
MVPKSGVSPDQTQSKELSQQKMSASSLLGPFCRIGFHVPRLPQSPPKWVVTVTLVNIQENKLLINSRLCHPSTLSPSRTRFCALGTRPECWHELNICSILAVITYSSQPSLPDLQDRECHCSKNCVEYGVC